MRHLLFHHQWGEGTAHKEVYDLQESLPLELFVQVVQEQQRKHLSAVSECLQLQLMILRGKEG